MKSYYFDHSASSPMWPSVIRTMSEIMNSHYANPSSSHQVGLEAKKLLEKARSNIANLMGASEAEIIFTSGGTEGNNLAIKGTLEQAGRGKKHLIISAVEHPSVLACAKQLEKQGVDLTIFPVNSAGYVDPNQLAATIRKETNLVSIMHVNHEIGTVQPIERIGKVLRKFPQVKFHVDGVQATGKVPFCWRDTNVDFYTASAHKFGGPKGAGFMLIKENLSLSPLQSGGEQERGIRSGTQNLPAIVGMAQALRLSCNSQAVRRATLFKLRRSLLKILAAIPFVQLNGITDAYNEERYVAPHIVNFSYPHLYPEVLVHFLEQSHIYVSSQSACSAKQRIPSRTLLASGYDEDRAASSIRISLGDEHTLEDIYFLGKKIKLALAQLKDGDYGG